MGKAKMTELELSVRKYKDILNFLGPQWAEKREQELRRLVKVYGQA